jgi:hypothetical protein
MTCIPHQLQLAFDYFPLVRDGFSAVGLSCIVDNCALPDSANIAYVSYTEAGRKIPLQIDTKFRLTVLDDSKKSYEEKLAILTERLRGESWSGSPVIIR